MHGAGPPGCSSTGGAPPAGPPRRDWEAAPAASGPVARGRTTIAGRLTPSGLKPVGGVTESRLELCGGSVG